MTGLTSLNVELDAKRLEILKAALPGVTRIGVLSAPQDVTNRQRVTAIERAADTLGLQLHLLPVSDADLLSGVFDAARRAHATALMVLGSPLMLAHQTRIVELATQARMPVVSAWRDFAAAGGFMSYGTNVSAMFYRAATYVDKILKGANPAVLPVEQAATFELVINLKVARALGLTVPQSLRARADHVIE